MDYLCGFVEFSGFVSFFLTIQIMLQKIHLKLTPGPIKLINFIIWLKNELLI
jgi:hypothetical protein